MTASRQERKGAAFHVSLADFDIEPPTVSSSCPWLTMGTIEL
jgi:hypothetical protein